MGSNTEGERRDLIARAWLLAQEGKRTREIGQILGVSHVTAALWIKQGREADSYIELFHRATLRAQALVRLDIYREVITDALREHGEDLEFKDKLDAVNTLLRVDEREAKLAALDAPPWKEREMPEGEVDVELVRRLSEIQRENKADQKEIEER